MDNSLNSSLEFTLTEEGGYIAHPSNPQVRDKSGITLARLRRLRAILALA